MPVATAAFSATFGISRPRDCCTASLASESSSAMTSAARRRRRASPTWPIVLVKSATLASMYWARRRRRGSCPSSQLTGNSRPLTLRLSKAIASLLLERLPDLVERGFDAGHDGGGELLHPLAFGHALAGEPRKLRRRVRPVEARRLFESGDRSV